VEVLLVELILRLLLLRQLLMLLLLLLLLLLCLVLLTLDVDFNHFPILPVLVPLAISAIPVHVGGSDSRS
jgi:hypothetical protein